MIISPSCLYLFYLIQHMPSMDALTVCAMIDNMKVIPYGYSQIEQANAQIK